MAQQETTTPLPSDPTGSLGLKKRTRTFVGRFIPHELKFRTRKVIHYGRSLHCPLCGSHVRRYLDTGGLDPIAERLEIVGAMPRSAVECPVCLGQDRTRFQMLYLERELDALSKPLRILHLAPELGMYLKLRDQPHLDYVLGDLLPERYRFADNVLRCDITELPFDDGRFDVVIASHVLEHVPADDRALAEIARVLSAGGTSVLLTPVSQTLEETFEDPSVTGEMDRLRTFGQKDHVRIYARDFANRIESAGLACEEYSPESLPADVVTDQRLNPAERLYIGHKPA